MYFDLFAFLHRTIVLKALCGGKFACVAVYVTHIHTDTINTSSVHGTLVFHVTL